MAIWRKSRVGVREGGADHTIFQSVSIMWCLGAKKNDKIRHCQGALAQSGSVALHFYQYRYMAWYWSSTVRVRVRVALALHYSTSMYTRVQAELLNSGYCIHISVCGNTQLTTLLIQ